MLDSQTKALHVRIAGIIKAVAHPLRVAVVDYLSDGEKSVQQIADHIGSERSNVSRHLAVMLKAGTLRCRKEGLMVYYALRNASARKFLDCAMQAVAQNVSEDRKLLSRAPKAHKR